MKKRWFLLTFLGLIFFINGQSCGLSPNNISNPDGIIFNQGGNMEGHTPRGFQGSGTGLFTGDNLNPNFPNDDGLQIFLSFDISSLNNVNSALLSTKNVQFSGTPFDTLGNLILEQISYDSFSSKLYNHPVESFSCTFSSSAQGPFQCDITEAVQNSIGESFVQFRLRMEKASDLNSQQDLVMFFTSDSNTNEPGIFEIEIK